MRNLKADCRSVLCWLCLASWAGLTTRAAPPASADWIQTSRAFLVDAYQPPMVPKLEYDAKALIKTMVAMHANTVRIGTMGKYAMIQGVRFTKAPGLGNRDLLAETIAAAKPYGIHVIPYVSTGHKLAWSMITRDYPQYAQVSRPGGGPVRSHMYVGEDQGTVCWNTPYRQAYLDMVRHIVRDYDIDGIYFDTWRPFYFWPPPQVCYGPGCRDGFRRATGKELPWHAHWSDYTPAERKTVAEYHQWYQNQLMGVVRETRRIVKQYKNIPLIYNINNPEKIASEDPRVIHAMDAFLYERSPTLLGRAEGISLARATGLYIWAYIGVYNNWPRVIPNQLSYEQEIFTTTAFGGAPIVAQPYAYVTQAANRHWVAYPFSVLQQHEADFRGFDNLPYAAVVYADADGAGSKRSTFFGSANARTATRGAFAACLDGHLQVSSVLVSLLDHPRMLARYAVIYLADTPHLSSREVENLEHYVANGGGLMVSYKSSLDDARMKPAPRFALEDLLHVRPLQPAGRLAATIRNYRCETGGPNDLYLRSREDARGALVPLWFYQPVEVLAGGTTRADIVTGDGRPILPGVVASRYGKGRVVYLASSLESLYTSTGWQAIGRFLRQTVESAARTPPPYQVDGPSTLITNMTEKGNLRVLHLLNWTSNPDNEGGYLPPIKNVRIRVPVPAGRQLGSVTVFPDSAFHYHVSGGELDLRFPRIGAYEAAAIEWK